MLRYFNLRFFSADLQAARTTPTLKHYFLLQFSQILDGGVIRLVRRLTHLHDAHYPETLREAVILTSSPASSICHMALSLVKPFLAPRTRQKINVVTEITIGSQEGKSCIQW